MSRARHITYGDGRLWYDSTKGGRKATDEQLELLATIEQIDMDDLLDAHPTQAEIIARLRDALGGNPIPEDVLERRQKWRQQRQVQPSCRKCGKVGDSTRHHFIPRWLLRELSGYATKWADRSKSTIPLCINCHRDIHSRDNGDVSIVDMLNDTERAFAQAALEALTEERSRLGWLIVQGDASVYEARLLQDFVNRRFCEQRGQNGRVDDEVGRGAISRVAVV